MGTCDALGYVIRPANAAQRGFQRGASTKAGAWLFSKTAHHLDRVLLARTHGRTALATVVAGIPVITVTTTGAKSGLPRSLPLLGVRFKVTLRSSARTSARRTRRDGSTTWRPIRRRR